MMEGRYVYLVICLAFVVNAFPYDHDIPARISTYVPDVDLAPPGRQEEMIGSMEANELLNILGLSKETIPSSSRESSSSSLSSSSERNRFAHPFMVNLYNSLADPMSGLTFGRRPYNATKIRAVPEGGRGGRLGFQFNLSLVESNVALLQAEFHLYRLRPRWTTSHDTKRPNYFQVHVYQLMSSDTSSLEGARLVGLRLMSAKGTGWEVFNIRDTVQDWLNNETSNFGLYITVTSLSGQPLPDNMLRFAKRARHDNSRQPILVLFTQESLDRRSGKRNVSQHSIDETPPSALSTMYHETSSSELQRRKRSLAKHRAYVEGRNQSEDATRSGGCLRKSMYVSFESIGWSPWIIAPKGYDAYRCNGGCPFNPRSTEDYTWSNYAKVKAIMNRRKRGVSPPCCVPSEFHPLGLTILYLEPETRNIVITELPDMIVAKCGCR
ncbi:bone morphogenetic protein 4 [Strongylocentrotus purpuratus]|uniref:TGF-beta family profile domain-containing protein n=1 Tax=Strongylocentrotus purpuratus TaxID=7668 RepID=A0A7M7HN92_STRPU|nr:bone morphogenetic protein 4 [Strongylocentrotus purpuratus]